MLLSRRLRRPSRCWAPWWAAGRNSALWSSRRPGQSSLHPTDMPPATNTSASASTLALAAAQDGQTPAASLSGRSARKSPAVSEVKGATALMRVAAKSSTTGKATSLTSQPPPPSDGAPLTLEQIEAKLLSAIQVSVNEQRDLVKQRAQSVRSHILKNGQVAPERLFIVAPKSAGSSAKGDHRVNLSLS